MKPAKMNQKIDELIEEKLELKQTLAAELEKTQKMTEYALKLDEWNDELQKQLAAEREELAIIERSRDAWQKQVAGLTEALAAEREKTKQAISAGKKYQTYMEKQLAAAVEALQMLRDYQNGCPLPSYEKGWTEAMVAMADAVLAKIGGKHE